MAFLPSAVADAPPCVGAAQRGQRGETLGPDGERRSTVTGWCAELWVMTPAQPRQLGLVLPSFSGLNPVIIDWPPELIKSGGSLIAGTALAGYTIPRPAEGGSPCGSATGPMPAN